MAVAAFTGVVSERQYPDIEVRELTLVNGMRLAIKETDFLADEVLVTAVAVGGLSEVGTDELQVSWCVWGVCLRCWSLHQQQRGNVLPSAAAFEVGGMSEVRPRVCWTFCGSSGVRIVFEVLGLCVEFENWFGWPSS
jgi:hypothetical protein